MDKPNNSCYKRVYVGDMAGSTLTVNGKPIVNNIDGDTVVGIDQIGVLDKDAFGNDFYQIDRYQKKTVDNKDTVPGLYIGRDHITAEPCAPCTNTPGDSVNLETDYCTEFTQTIIGTSVLQNLVFKHWVRTDVDCKKVDTNNPNYIRSVYLPKDYQRRTYGEYDSNGKWITLPKDTTCLPVTVTVDLNTINVSDWEFTYENGVLIAREEGYTDYLEPENNTVIYTVS